MYHDFIDLVFRQQRSLFLLVTRLRAGCSPFRSTWLSVFGLRLGQVAGRGLGGVGGILAGLDEFQLKLFNALRLLLQLARLVAATARFVRAIERFAG